MMKTKYQEPVCNIISIEVDGVIMAPSDHYGKSMRENPENVSAHFVAGRNYI